MEDRKVEDVLEYIERFVVKQIEVMSASQKATLKALLYSGYKGEREYVLLELLQSMGEKSVSESPLIESFTSTFTDGEEIYWRIRPEFYRALRKRLLR